MLETYRLAEDYIDAEAERRLLAAVARTPDLYWKLQDLLPQDSLAAEPEAWTAISAAIEAEQPVELPDDWMPDDNPEALAARLADLYQRRRLAEAIERAAQAMHDPERPAREAIQAFQDEAERIQASVRDFAASRLQWGTDIVGNVLDEARARWQRRQETGRALFGISTGLSRLDDMTNGLGAALYVLAGAPGAGKTTLALQIALRTALEGEPVLYVTYENSPSNLILKGVCARAGVPASQVEKGFGECSRLGAAAFELRDAFSRLAILEGTSKLRMPEIRARVLQALNRHRSSRCLVVFDYLQRAAHATGYTDLRHSVSALAGELRDLANRVASPVLLLSSQNRTAGNYGGEGSEGSARLDSLKESGDLEYSADLVMFLKHSLKRSVPHPARAVDLVVAKNRFGDVGSIPLVFKADVGVIREESHR